MIMKYYLNFSSIHSIIFHIKVFHFLFGCFRVLGYSITSNYYATDLQPTLPIPLIFIFDS